MTTPHPVHDWFKKEVSNILVYVRKSHSKKISLETDISMACRWIHHSWPVSPVHCTVPI